ncbi:hypothetical protein F7725_015560, partial [Dissostichus mawsoni]
MRQKSTSEIARWEMKISEVQESPLFLWMSHSTMRLAGMPRNMLMNCRPSKTNVPNYRKYLRSSGNKTALCMFVSNYIVTAAPQRLHSGDSIILAGGFDEGEEVKSICTAGVSSLTSLYSDQEEADTRMVLVVPSTAPAALSETGNVPRSDQHEPLPKHGRVQPGLRELQALQKPLSVSSSCSHSNHYPNAFNSFSHHAPVYGQFSSQSIIS